MSDSTGNPFHKNDRVRVNQAGAAHWPIYKDLVGSVCHEPSQRRTVAIRFPGRSAPIYLPHTSIERVDVGVQQTHSNERNASLSPEGAER